MKYTLIPLVLCSLFSSCTEDTTVTPDTQEASGTTTPAVAIPADLITTTALSTPISITDAKKKITVGDDITITGRIGGRKLPFLSKKAAFLLMDDKKAIACDVGEDDHCSMPWDFCCEKKETILAAAALIQVIDEKGTVLPTGLKGYGGLAAGDHVSITGTIAQKSTAEAYIINASKIYKIPQ